MSPFGQPINLSQTCTYFKHERLIYWIETSDLTFEGTHVEDEWLKIPMSFNSAMPKTLHFRLLDGVLVESGVLVQYFSNDNLLGRPLETKVLQDTLDFRKDGLDFYSVRVQFYF